MEIKRHQTRFNSYLLKEQTEIIVSQYDCEIFFNAIMKSNYPNKELQKAADQYKCLFSE